jgi:O-antigen/teichoic acid export membrane protein
MSNNTKTIAKNTGWYGLENAINSILTVFTSIAIARTLGPAKMGYIIYVTWIAAVVSDLGGLGIPATTRKYMAEFLGKGDKGTARYIYLRTFFLQAALATLTTLGLVFWVLRDAAGDYKLASVLVVLSIWPSMANAISAQANVASEELSKNLPASAVSILLYFLMILATVVFHWGVVGVGASMLGMRLADFLVRVFPTMKRIRKWDTVHVQPEGLSNRMLTFAWQSVAVLLVEMVVWQRSEIILLKHLCADIRQLAYYSVAFSMAERLLISASIFASAASATIFAQYGRDKSRLPEITASTFRYLAITSIPLHVIAAALAAPALLLLYGNAYTGAAMVVTLAPLLCMPKAFIGPVRSLLQTYERQSFVIAATVLAGIVDIGVAWLLIPAHGAVGACIASGVAEVTAIGTMWAIGIYLYKVKLPWVLVAKVTFISVLASLTAHFIASTLPPLWGILCGGGASVVLLFALFYLLRVLKPEDRARFNVLIRALPARFAAPVNAVLLLLIRPEIDNAVTAKEFI